MIRGQNVSRALSILKFTQKRAAQPIAKCLNSAIANATYNAEQQNIAIDPDDLWVKACYVDMGPTKHRRRMRPAPQGRAYREQRHYCHITIEVTSEEKPKTEKELKAEAAKARRAETKKAEPKKAAKKDAAKAPKAKKDEAAETAAPVEETVEAAPAVEETVETAPAAEETVEAQAEEVAAEDAAPAAEEAEKTEGETEAETK